MKPEYWVLVTAGKKLAVVSAGGDDCGDKWIISLHFLNNLLLTLNKRSKTMHTYMYAMGTVSPFPA